VWIFDSAPLWEDPFAHLALASAKTDRIGLATAVLIPSERSALAMASGIATIARLSGGRFRPCFGTGYTARMAAGQKPMPLDRFFEYVASVRSLLAGETAVVDGQPARMLHWPGLTADRPVQVPIWVSVLGPKGNARAPEVAEGTIGPPHPVLPTATLVSGTVLDPGESRTSQRVRAAVGPWRVVGWHTAYAARGPAAVRAMPGGEEWLAAVERSAPPEHRHLLTFEGHVTHMSERDLELLPYIDIDQMVGEPGAVGASLQSLAEAGFAEVIYTPAGPDLPRELSAFAAAYQRQYGPGAQPAEAPTTGGP
jgi:5,10-methylenetetrahydromethanopterin reductase